jgi:hypothetical protein
LISPGNETGAGVVFLTVGADADFDGVVEFTWAADKPTIGTFAFAVTSERAKIF